MKLLYEVPDYKKIRVIVDTDAACEADDSFAIAHALMSKKFEMKAILEFRCQAPNNFQTIFQHYFIRRSIF